MSTFSPSYLKSIRTNVDLIKEYTLVRLEELWGSNFDANLPKVKNGVNLASIKPKPGDLGRTLVVGGGPSIKKYHQLQALKQSKASQTSQKSKRLKIIACDVALKPLLNAGIEPDYVTSIDGDEKIAKFFEVEHLHNTIPILSVTSNPKTVEAVESIITEPIRWFVPVWDNYLDSKRTSVTRMMKTISGVITMDTFGNVGGFSYYLAGFLGANPMGLIGLDYSLGSLEKEAYDKAEKLAGSKQNISNHVDELFNIRADPYYEAYVNQVGVDNRLIEAVNQDALARNPEADISPLTKITDWYEIIQNPQTGKLVVLNMNWTVYRFLFLTSTGILADRLAKDGIPMPQIYNLSPDSSLWSSQIFYKDLQWFLKWRNKK